MIYEVVALIFITMNSYGQDIVENINVEFILKDDRLNNPLTGGMENPIISEADINRDGYKDLFIFDFNGKDVVCFLTILHNGQLKRIYEPNFSNFSIFNKTDWVLLRDFNGDGIEDAFVKNSINEQTWLSVYKGFIDEDILGFIEYKSKLTFLKNEYSEPIFTGKFELPAVDDIDGDGDLDILTYARNLGNLTFFKNNSIEIFGHKDSLNFEITTECWGGFLEVGDSVILSNTPGNCIPDTTFVQNLMEVKNEISNKKGIHNGATLLTLDIDNDLDKDLLLGDVFRSESLIMLENVQSNNVDHIVKQTPCFPNYDFPIKLKYKPAAYSIDVDFDNKKDIIVSPFSNQLGNIENVNVALFYKNEEGRFRFIERDWLTKDIIDVGSSSHPVTVDYNGDGLQDLVVSNYGFFSEEKPVNSQLFLFENKGSMNEPCFEFIDSNWLDLSSNLIGNSFAPVFGDIDNDNDIDVIIGLSNGELAYGENKSNSLSSFELDNFESFFGYIDAGQFATPTMYDLNGDNYLDLFIGNDKGRILYFENKLLQGSQVYERTPDDDFFGEIQLNADGFFRTYAAPIIHKINSEPHLFVGGIDGSVKQFTNIKINEKANIVNENLLENFYGYYSKIAFLNQNENNGFFLGNIKGGLNFFIFDEKVTDASLEATNETLVQKIKIYPNPVYNDVIIKIPGLMINNTFVTIYASNGKPILGSFRITKNIQNLKNIISSSGIYYIILENKQLEITFSSQIIKI